MAVEQQALAMKPQFYELELELVLRLGLRLGLRLRLIFVCLGLSFEISATQLESCELYSQPEFYCYCAIYEFYENRLVFQFASNLGPIVLR